MCLDIFHPLLINTLPLLHTSLRVHPGIKLLIYKLSILNFGGGWGDHYPYHLNDMHTAAISVYKAHQLFVNASMLMQCVYIYKHYFQELQNVEHFYAGNIRK